MSYKDLRIADLIAKVAQVNIKDTVRVIKALELVAWGQGCTADDIAERPLDFGKPTPDNASACEAGYRALVASLDEDAGGELSTEIAEIRSIGRGTCNRLQTGSSAGAPEVP